MLQDHLLAALAIQSASIFKTTCLAESITNTLLVHAACQKQGRRQQIALLKNVTEY